jgi:hypothetical protein
LQPSIPDGEDSDKGSIRCFFRDGKDWLKMPRRPASA